VPRIPVATCLQLREFTSFSEVLQPPPSCGAATPHETWQQRQEAVVIARAIM
jgi:hypothetical protein